MKYCTHYQQMQRLEIVFIRFPHLFCLRRPRLCSMQNYFPRVLNIRLLAMAESLISQRDLFTCYPVTNVLLAQITHQNISECMFLSLDSFTVIYKLNDSQTVDNEFSFSDSGP